MNIYDIVGWDVGSYVCAEISGGDNVRIDSDVSSEGGSSNDEVVKLENVD